MSENSLPVVQVSVEDYEIINELKVTFTHWLTLVTGENGTGKSSLLRKIKLSFPENSVLYNPKRNSVKKELIQAINEVRGGSRKKQNLISEVNKNFDDTNSHSYSSFSETIAAEYDSRRQSLSGEIPPNSIIEDLKNEYGNLISDIFPNYKSVDWEFRSDGPYFRIKKFNKHLLEVNQLSTGEQEVLSLVFSVQSMIDSAKIILIDEPELHLNWALEEKLFEYLKKVANRNKIQIVVATHSRVISEDSFRDNIIYLYFDREGNILVNSSVPKSTKEKIIGSILRIISSRGSEKIITVEDDIHEYVIDLISKKTAKMELPSIHKMSNRSSVEGLYSSVRNASTPGILENSYFMVDGDGKRDDYPDDKNFICLTKGYNMETYFIMNLKLVSAVSGESVLSIKKRIAKILSKSKKELAKKPGSWRMIGNVSYKDINDRLLATIDGKIILDNLISTLRFRNKEEYLEKFVEYILQDKRRFKKLFDSKFVSFFN